MEQHVFFDSLEEWLKKSETETPVFCLPLQENHPSGTTGIRLMYGVIQLSQSMTNGYVHHIRFLVTTRTEPDLEAKKRDHAEKLDRAFQHLLNWLSEAGFTDIRQALLGVPEHIKPLHTYLPKGLAP